MDLETDESSHEGLSTSELSEDVLITDQEIGGKMQDIEQLQTALESLSKITEYVISNDNYSLTAVTEELGSLYHSLGLDVVMPTVSLESLQSVDRKVATESILDNIRDGFSRIMNMFLWVDDFIHRKLLWGFKSFKNLVSMIGSDIDTAIENAATLPNSTKEVITIRRGVGTHLRTPNGGRLTHKIAKEILSNHIEVLENFLSQKEILQALHGEDLEYFRKVTSDAIRNKTTDKSSIAKANANMADNLTKIFQDFKTFRGRPLADGKTLQVEFDQEAPERLIFYKDLFQMSVVSNHTYTRPFEAIRLNKKEGQELAQMSKRLHQLYKKVDDYTVHISFLRQTIIKLDMTQLFVVPVTAIVLGPFLAAIISLGVGIATLIHMVCVIIRTIGYTASSLSYYAIRESCNYIKDSR